MPKGPLDQKTETDQFKLDKENFVIGEMPEFLEQAFSGNRVVILASSDHTSDEGLFQALSTDKVDNVLANQKVKIALELPKNDQTKLAAYMKSGEPKDIGEEFNVIKPLLISAKKYNIEVHFVDLNENEKIMTAKMEANEKEFNYQEKLAAAQNDSTRARIAAEFETKYAEDLKAWRKERLEKSTNRMAENIGKLMEGNDSKVLVYTGKSHTSNEEAKGVDNATADLDEILAKYGSTLLVSVFPNYKDVVVSAMKVDKQNPPKLFDTNERDLPEMVLSFPPREVQILLQQQKLAGLAYENKVAVKDVLLQGLNVYRSVMSSFTAENSDDGPKTKIKKHVAQDIIRDSYEKLVHGDFDSAKSIIKEANDNKVFDGIVGPNSLRLNTVMTTFPDLIERIRKAINNAAGKEVVSLSPDLKRIDRSVTAISPTSISEPQHLQTLTIT